MPKSNERNYFTNLILIKISFLFCKRNFKSFSIRFFILN